MVYFKSVYTLKALVVFRAKFLKVCDHFADAGRHRVEYMALYNVSIVSHG